MARLALALLLLLSSPALAAPRCDGLIDPAFASAFASDWIAAWNAHDMPRLLAHYRDDFEMLSPDVIPLGAPDGVLKGRQNAGSYWLELLAGQPHLTRDLLGVSAGVSSVAIQYRDAGRGPATEVLTFDAGCRVVRDSAYRGL